MPPLPAIPQGLRVALIGKLDGDADVVNRIYFQYPFTSTPPGNLNALCATIAGHWNTDMIGLYGGEFTQTQVDAEDLTSTTSPVGTATVSHVGTRGTARTSASSCALIRNHIGRRYRGGHPRTYTACGISTDLTTEQQWSTSFLASLVTAWSNLIGHINGDIDAAYAATGTNHVNVSYYHGFTNVTYPSGRTYPRPTLRATPVVDNVTSYSANPNVASQRRRNLTP